MPQPGWYADPDGTPRRLRWWDGTRWTEHVHGQPGATAVGTPRRGGGPWPWLALGLVAALAGAGGVALGTGIIGGPQTASVSPSPGATSPSTSQLPTATPAPPSSRPARTPTPFPTVPTQPPPATGTGCPTSAPGTGWVSDGQLRVAIPATWRRIEAPAWLECGEGVAAPQDSAAASLGVVRLGGGDLRATADAVWSLALLDAGVATADTRESTAVRVAGEDAWLSTGTIGSSGRALRVTMLVVDSGDDPSVLLTVVDEDDTNALAAVERLMASVRHA